MTIKKDNLKRGSGFFKQQHEQNKEVMKKKRKKAKKTTKAFRSKKNVS